MLAETKTAHTNQYGLSAQDMLQFVSRVLALTDVFGPMEKFDISWRTDGDYAPVTFYTNCSDVFAWGCSDGEDITPSNIDILEKAIKDCAHVGDINATSWAPVLFAARIRKLRPQGAAYPKDPSLWPLFDACGPERPVEVGNPLPHPSQQKEPRV